MEKLIPKREQSAESGTGKASKGGLPDALLNAVNKKFGLQ